MRKVTQPRRACLRACVRVCGRTCACVQACVLLCQSSCLQARCVEVQFSHFRTRERCSSDIPLPVLAYRAASLLYKPLNLQANYYLSLTSKLNLSTVLPLNQTSLSCVPVQALSVATAYQLNLSHLDCSPTSFLCVHWRGNHR